MSDFRIDKITNREGTRGTQVAGITTFSGISGVTIPSGPTSMRYVSNLVLNKKIPTEGLKVFLDGNITEGRVWPNLAEDPNIPDGSFGASADAEPPISADGYDFGGGTSMQGVEIPVNPSEIFNNGEGTIFAFIRPDDISNRQTLVSGYGNGDHRWAFELEGSGNLTGGNHDDAYHDATVDFTVNAWQSFAVTLDQKGTNGEERYNTQKYYLNGALNSSFSQTTANRGWYGGTDCVLSIARRSNNKTQFEYDGEFAIFLAYNRVLSEAEILSIHNTFKGRYGL